ncbi:sodium/glutamate symporter [Vibrio maritimus]|uniref:Sodium/glutamate symporter n=1 Tax=Vibrio maritimus TaxID=990268 RepID=A0A090T8D9_9VIBR|nr:sodium/glutamate symporter [Vibrio maritimus]
MLVDTVFRPRCDAYSCHEHGSIVNRFGPSPQAFMVVPIVGAFFIDIVNLVILQGFIAVIG